MIPMIMIVLSYTELIGSEKEGYKGGTMVLDFVKCLYFRGFISCNKYFQNIPQMYRNVGISYV